jgi:hypothetical protein
VNGSPREPEAGLLRFGSVEMRNLEVAFANHEGLEPPARIIAMATAFEVLLGFPEQDKIRYFAGTVNRYIPPNRLPTTSLLWGHGRVSGVTENSVGWWCREFHNLRNRIVRGEEVSETNFLNDRGEEHLRIALSLFEECILGLLVELGKLREEGKSSPFLFAFILAGSARSAKRCMVSVVRRFFPSFASESTPAFRVFQSEQKKEPAHLRIEFVVQTPARARFLLAAAQS